MVDAAVVTQVRVQVGVSRTNRRHRSFSAGCWYVRSRNSYQWIRGWQRSVRAALAKCDKADAADYGRHKARAHLSLQAALRTGIKRCAISTRWAASGKVQVSPTLNRLGTS